MSLLAVRNPLGLVSGPSSSDSSMCRLGLFSVLVGRPSLSPAIVIWAAPNQQVADFTRRPAQGSATRCDTTQCLCINGGLNGAEHSGQMA